jgi:hypothetical protein
MLALFKTNRFRCIKLLMPIPEFLKPFFWEYAHKNIDTMRHASTIMARIMERGSWEAMIWLKKTYSWEQIINFLINRGKDSLPPRELNYWLLISGVSSEDWRKLVDSAKANYAVWRGHAS